MDPEYHPSIVEHGLVEVIVHIMKHAVKQGRLLGTILVNGDKSEDTDEIGENFRCCRKELLLCCKALSVLSANEELKKHIAAESRLDYFVELCYAHEIVLTETIHDNLMNCVLEISLDGNTNICIFYILC